MGGTFMSMPGDYRDYFIRNLHDALSGHSSSSVHEAVCYSEQVWLCQCYTAITHQCDLTAPYGPDWQPALALRCSHLPSVHCFSQAGFAAVLALVKKTAPCSKCNFTRSMFGVLQSRTKCIGLTIETRPDYCLPPHLQQMLSYGCTRRAARICSFLLHPNMAVAGRAAPCTCSTNLQLLFTAAAQSQTHSLGSEQVDCRWVSRDVKYRVCGGDWQAGGGAAEHL